MKRFMSLVYKRFFCQSGVLWSHVGLVLVLLLSLSSCSIEKRIERKTNELADQLAKEPQWEQLPQETITWNQALERAMKDNLDIKRGLLAVKDSENRVMDLYTDFIPGINLDALLTKDIKSLGQIKSTDVERRMNILFNIPSLTQIPYNYYSAKASVFQSKMSMELKRRELISRLYKACQEYKFASNSYEIERMSIPYDDDGTQKTRIEKDWEAKRKTISSQLSSLIGNINKRWYIQMDTVPVLDWDKYKKASTRLDQYVLSLMAMELEGARLGIIGIKMQYFPELNVNFYSPSLFSSTGGTYGGFFSGSGDTMVNMSLSMKVDTQLRVWNQLKSAQASYKLLQQEIRIRMLERREKVKLLIKSREDFESWSKVSKKYATFLQGTCPKDSEEYKKNQQDVIARFKDVNSNETKNAETEAALILEYGLL